MSVQTKTIHHQNSTYYGKKSHRSNYPSFNLTCGKPKRYEVGKTKKITSFWSQSLYTQLSYSLNEV